MSHSWKYALLRNIHQSFQNIPDPRTGKPNISLADALMSGLAMFALKDPSMLAFDQRRQQDEKNLQITFHLENVPSDSSMREILDPVEHEQFRPAFRNVFTWLQRHGALQNLYFLDGYYLMALDGTEYFSSQQVHCSGCLEKHHRNGKVSYHHQISWIRCWVFAVSRRKAGCKAGVLVGRSKTKRSTR